ncbi:MAG: hypothetical protein GX590_02965 [Lentisphaerae bacterium]|nr:hypothetical protein [Lentisphaerota bacterium]
MTRWHMALAALLLLQTRGRAADEEAPANRLPATAFRILEGTHNRESAYASLAVARSGRVYVGPAVYGTNAYLVELDPASGAQRIVVDTRKLCGLEATGFAAQSKIHTRIFEAPSGVLYFGSKQGYPRKGESRYTYRGGFLMSYDPASDRAVNLGRIPFRGHGVYDVAVDERRQLMHVTTCADELGDYFWFTFDLARNHFEGLGPRLLTNTHPLMAPDGSRVHVLTREGHLACYRPDTDELTVRPMLLGTNSVFAPTNGIVQCALAPDGATAYLLPNNRPEIIAVNLDADGEGYPARRVARYASVDACTTMDPSFGPDGRLYAVSNWREPGDKRRAFLHVVTYDPSTETTVDHGAITITNAAALRSALRSETPFGKAPFTGVRELADGTLAPRSAQGIAISADGTIYVMTLSPLCVLRISPLHDMP